MEHEALESNNQSETSSSIFNGDEDSVTRFPCSAVFKSTINQPSLPPLGTITTHHRTIPSFMSATVTMGLS